MRAQIRGLQQAERNANDGISVIQTAEGALNEVGNILIRMRELAVQSASTGSISNSERSFLQNEFSALQSEITRIAQGTKFGGAVLLDGSLSGSGNALQFQVGIFNDANVDRISLEIGNATASGLGIQASAATIATSTGAQSALSTIDSAHLGGVDGSAATSAQPRTGCSRRSTTCSRRRRTCRPPTRASATSTSRPRRPR